MRHIQSCTKCGKPSIPGLISGAGKCQFHWNEGFWGTEWAVKCEDDRKPARNLQTEISNLPATLEE